MTEIIEWVRFLLGIGFLLAGLGIFIVEMIGVFKLKYVLNRMHAAAMGDTLGIGFSLVGLMIINGWNFTTFKIFLVVVFLWLSSPVSSHLIARFETTTNENLKEQCKMPEEKIQEELQKGQKEDDT